MRTAFAPDRILEVRTRWEFDGAPADFGRLSDVVVVDWRAASTRISHQDFSIMDRQRLAMWQRRFYDQLDSARELLLAAPIASGKAARANP